MSCVWMEVGVDWRRSDSSSIWKMDDEVRHVDLDGYCTCSGHPGRQVATREYLSQNTEQVNHQPSSGIHYSGNKA